MYDGSTAIVLKLLIKGGSGRLVRYCFEIISHISLYVLVLVSERAWVMIAMGVGPPQLLDSGRSRELLQGRM